MNANPHVIYYYITFYCTWDICLERSPAQLQGERGNGGESLATTACCNYTILQTYLYANNLLHEDVKGM